MTRLFQWDGNMSKTTLFLLDGKWRGMSLFLLDGNRIKTTLFLSGRKGRGVRTRLFPMDGNRVKTTLFLSGGQGDAVMMQQFPKAASASGALFLHFFSCGVFHVVVVRSSCPVIKPE
jgi:hypothetical protein